MRAVTSRAIMKQICSGSLTLSLLTGLELAGAAMHIGALKLDHPLMHIQAAASAGKPQMAIIGMGLDRVIKRYELHKDPAGWDYFFTVIPCATTPGPQKVSLALQSNP